MLIDNQNVKMPEKPHPHAQAEKLAETRLTHRESAEPKPSVDVTLSAAALLAAASDDAEANRSNSLIQDYSQLGLMFGANLRALKKQLERIQEIQNDPTLSTEEKAQKIAGLTQTITVLPVAQKDQQPINLIENEGDSPTAREDSERIVE